MSKLEKNETVATKGLDSLKAQVQMLEKSETVAEAAMKGLDSM